jgi:hypothetical protein
MNNQIYLSHFRTELPSNCIFNKIATGCGGTSLEIENMNRDSIITVPLEQMIDNKVCQYPNNRTPNDFLMFGVKAGITKYDIMQYLRTNKVHKIIVTYDSLYRVIEAITELNQRDLKTYFLLIDEIHYILNNYSLRKDAIKRVLEVYPMFNNWCFMTATPNEPEFILEELKGIRIETAPFELELINIENVKTFQVTATTKKLIIDYLENRLPNAHIFVNSVEIIASLIKACKLTNENCKVVWSKRNKIYKDVISGIKRSDVGSPAKKINFYTSTCFEGSDILDMEGQYIIVSDGRIAHTLNDISTSLRQILGRIRNTKYRNQAIHIFKETKFSECKSYQEYKDKTVKALQYSEKWIKLLIEEGKDIKEEILNENYITKSNGILSIDKNLITYDLMKYKLAKQTYGTIAIVKKEQEKAGFKAVNICHNLQPSDLIKRNEEAKIKFKDAFEEYIILKDATLAGKYLPFTMPDETNYLRIALLESYYDILRDAFNIVGVEEVRRLNYNQTNIKKSIIGSSDKSQANKIISILKNSGIERNEFISSEESKRKLQSAYNHLGILKTAKGSDLSKYFEVENKTVRKDIKGVNKVVRGFQIVREKFVFTDAK